MKQEDRARAGAGANLRLLGRLLMGAPPDRGLDWQAIVELARRHRVSPLLFWCLVQRSNEADGQVTQEGWAAVPATVQKSLRGDFGVAVARVDRAERQLAEAVGALAAAGVPAMVVKGAALAAFYPDPALRLYTDLDLLVPRAQLDEAEAALHGLGYRCSQPKDWALAHHYHLPPMVRDRAQLAVEVHWRLDDTWRVGCLPVDELWSRAVPWSVQGQAAQRLEVVDAALHLCRHAVVQNRLHAGLGSLTDLRQVTDGWGRAEWEALARRAADYGLRSAVYLMLALVQGVLGQAAPQEVLAALRPSGGASLPDDLVERLLLPEDLRTAKVTVALARTGSQETQSARLRRLMRYLFPPRERLALEYEVRADSPSAWLIYLRWPVDLLRRYGPTVWDVLRGKRAARAAWEREVWLERWLGQEVSGETQEARR